ncbi:MAG: response regulator [Candidatus Competibacteraceae bacterium]|nr:MAG: response regulator [Candidatus Competibacteraceae bacterium]
MPEPAEQTIGSNLAQQELLDILRAEIEQIAEDADGVLALASAADSTPTARDEALSGYAEQLERLGDAAASVGLLGLRQVCAGLQTNLKHLAGQSDPLTAEQHTLLTSWTLPALAYLRALDDRSTGATLARCLEDAGWPQPLSTAKVAPLIELLVSAKLVTEEEGAEARPRQAQPEDVSLELPEDVNPELLDGLLRELPGQAADFSAAIQRLATGEGQLDDVKVAQRIAHTLKGAGNTVGVRGIATLTHQIEDILQALAKQGALPDRPLADMLQNAADCLESMSEALLGIGSPPTQARAVLQEVLDWANRIDQTGIPTDEDRPPPVTAWTEPAAQIQSAAPAPRAPEPASPPETPPASRPAPAPEITLRVPAPLVDNLLRLVGESIILTGQVQERVRRTMTQTRAVMGQNRLFQQLTAELEQLIDIRNVSSPLSKSLQRGDFDPLELEQYNELNTLTHRLVEAATDTHELNRTIEENLAALDTLLVDQGRLHRESQEAVLRTRMVPLQTLVPRLQRSVRQTCRLVDKEAELIVRGADTLIDSNVLNDMVDPLMHLLRNAVDHGIEPPEQRQRSGKPRAGRIELGFAREGNSIVIRCRDDGAGLDREAIRRTAVERGLLAADALPETTELERLILLPGFSTRDATTQTSGRGIGMDVVYSRLLEMKGALRIESQAGAGCLMVIRLPVTLIATHALLARMRNRLYAISDRGIEQIVYSGVGKIQKMGKTVLFQIGEDIHELTALDALLDLPPEQRARVRAAPAVLLVREETGNRRAVLVQDIVDSRDLVVKNLGSYLPKLNGIVGATILGDGSVAPVLDLPELLRAPAPVPAPRVAKPTAPTAAAASRPFALAVDDSLSARRSLAQCVQDAGFEVRTARDGLEAIAIIQGRRPDIVLADMEMPRMNGLDLTAHLRANPATRDLPIIMITSRSTEKHRREAERVGVDAYLTKPFVEDELLEQIHRLLRRS